MEQTIQYKYKNDLIKPLYQGCKIWKIRIL